MKTPAVVLLVSFLGISLIGSTPDSPAPDPWKPTDLLQPADLAKEIHEGHAMELLHTGFGVLYRSKHIPGSVYAGPAAKPEGIQHLLDAVKNLDRNAPIILYCGCCPFDHCPNVRPAFAALARAGFRNVKVLVMRENFKTDWIDKGYPVETSGAKQR